MGVWVQQVQTAVCGVDSSKAHGAAQGTMQYAVTEHSGKCVYVSGSLCCAEEAAMTLGINYASVKLD